MAFHRTETVLLEDGQSVRVPVFSASMHEGRTRDAVIGLKYRNERGNVRSLAALLVPLVPDCAELITWVPTTDRRRHDRGIDHAELLARRVGVPVRMPVRQLLRRTDHRHQTGRSRQERLEAPRFTAHPAAAGRHVVMVDDVVTTGATVRSAARALLAAGAAGVSCVSVCLVP